MTAFYNEIDPFAAQWLRNLIDAGHIAPGVVDTRSIEDIAPDELRDYTQVHFFAGIGVWSYALRLAGWPDNRPIWTGSCPCQPFSGARKGAGVADDRHLWPAFWWHIKGNRPATVIGEQVSSSDGLDWFDHVHANLEESGYTATALDLCAAGVGAPHIRQRLYWVAHTGGDGREGGLSWRSDPQREMVNGQAGCDGAANTPLEVNGLWRDADWIRCKDDGLRAIESGLEPLVDGLAGRVALCRAYGNAIVAPLAQAFLTAVRETLPQSVAIPATE